jgi:hydrophobic/amphiphilic exporter-1 (mainly G- bacteria), HAE1 family
LYQQFAVTIAISVILSAFNALSLSPAMAALLLKPKDKNKKPGLLGRFFNWFNRMFARVTEGYIGVSAMLIRKAVVGLALLAIITVAAVGIGRKLPNSFLPDEDYGYV